MQSCTKILCKTKKRKSKILTLHIEMEIVTGDRYLESLVKFVEKQAGPLIEGTLVLKLNPVGLHYVESRFEALSELESLLAGAPVDYLRAYVSDLGDHRALEQLRRILRLLTSLKLVSVLLPPAGRDPTPVSLIPFGRLRFLELRGCDLSTSPARGLLELRHTLEKLICNDSTDALRHVFASRIAEIKSSPLWNRLTFVSCACNGLVLMDESLQLLPAVETLDLSRNKFAKVDNLQNCTKLKHLDLGFCHLRTIASFSEVSCQIVKLVLRNNALTTLRGIENLKSVEGLDVSYNIISNFSELEILTDLSLQNLWLEGNPLCCSLWYRAQVFSFFPQPDKLKLDEKHICTREFWERTFFVARRQKQPASFGFYSPAKGGVTLEGSIDTKRKKLRRLASIESEEQSTCIGSDQESVSCENDIHNKEEHAVSGEEAELVDLMNRIEIMKKERSDLWLQEFEEWMNQASANLADVSKHSGPLMNQDKGSYLKNKTIHKHPGETSRYISDSVQASGDDSSTNILESDNSFADTSIGFSARQYSDRIGDAASKFFMGQSVGESVFATERMDPNQEHLKFYYDKGDQSVKARNSLTAIDGIMDSRSSSAFLGSPPHYQEDILHRRINLEEEFLQLSAKSFSVASSDSDTSYSEEDSAKFGSFVPQVDQSILDKFAERSVDGNLSQHRSDNTFFDNRYEDSQFSQNGMNTLNSCAQADSCTIELKRTDCSPQLCGNRFPAGVHDGEILPFLEQEADWLKKKQSKRKPKKRVISLSEENNTDEEIEPTQKLNGSLDVGRDHVEDEQRKHDFRVSDDHRPVCQIYTQQSPITTSHIYDGGEIHSRAKSSSQETDDFVELYFNSNVADFGIQETCKQYVCCNCMLEENSSCTESQVAILLSSAHKLYLLLIDGSATSLRLLGCHGIEDVREVIVGLGLQVVRLCFERNSTYLFITRSIEKSRQLLCILNFFDSCAINDSCSLRSLEQVQVDLFERHVCGGSQISMFQYAIVLFWRNNLEEDVWLSRSLFVLEGHLLLCIEDFMQFGPLSEDAPSSSYFSLDSCCLIVDVYEMVMESMESHCVTLALKCGTTEFCRSHKNERGVEDDAALERGKPGSSHMTWKIKWLSEESLLKFVELLKAMHAALTTSPLLVRCIS